MPSRFILPNLRPPPIIVFVDMEIMKERLCHPFVLCGLGCLLLTAPTYNTTASEVALQRVPPLTVEQAPAYPENVARYRSGADVLAAPQSNSAGKLRLSSSTGDANIAEAALLCGDPTVGYALSSGKTTLIVSLSKIENIDTVSLLNRGARGRMSVAVSNSKLSLDDPQWRQVSRQDLGSAAIKANVGPSEAKYVKLTFEVSDPGRISALGIYAAPAMASFTMPRARQARVENRSESFALINYNLTDVHARARALYVSSGDDLKQANNMIDDQPATNYSFSPHDAIPTAVIDLGKATTLRRISALYSPGSGNLDFFVLRALPNSSKTQSLHLDDTTLGAMQHVGSVTDGSGRAAVDFPATSGRYIVLKWTPAAQGEPFSVAEVAAFGGEKNGSLLAANTVDTSLAQTESDGKTIQDGKDLGEGKDIPSEGADNQGADNPAEGPAPNLPETPPFTFVPEVLPTSP